MPPPLPAPDNRDALIALALAGPWRRFFARLIDMWVLALPTATLLGIALSLVSPGFADWIQRPGSDQAFGILSVPVILFVEAMVFALFGNTLGKALLGVVVTTVGAHRPSISQYLSRQAGVLWYGLALGVPFINLFTLARQHSRLKMGKQATYDEGRFTVKARPIGAARAVLAAALAAGLFITQVALIQVASSATRQ